MGLRARSPVPPSRQPKIVLSVAHGPTLRGPGGGGGGGRGPSDCIPQGCTQPKTRPLRADGCLPPLPMKLFCSTVPLPEFTPMKLHRQKQTVPVAGVFLKLKPFQQSVAVRPHVSEHPDAGLNGEPDSVKHQLYRCKFKGSHRRSETKVTKAIGCSEINT